MASIVFRNARLIDGIAAQPRNGISIVVEGERISTVGGADIPARGDATVIDLKGQTVLPGLIDTHVHATMMDEECLPLFLAAGVTTARDVGGKLENAPAPGQSEQRRATRPAAVCAWSAARRNRPKPKRSVRRNARQRTVRRCGPGEN